MDWSDAVVPLIVAAVGAVAVGVGAWIASRSALRSRLIDLTREDERERRAFQVRVVSAVNVLGVATAHLLRVRLEGMRAIVAQLRMQAASGATGTVTVSVDPDTLSPKEDARVVAATDAWRTVLAEAHVFASDATHAAMSAFDDHRAVVTDAINTGTRQNDLITAIAELEHAQEMCDDLRSYFAEQIYRELQAEMLTGTARVFFLGHVRRLRYFVKDADEKHRGGIAQVRARIAVERSNRRAAPPS
ncbi:hypothetical protein [uncultured Microbacterium sp.]|uniref:hypothetical protein n=1 Tax=uncultured Microbacterium sp. TaxID=191216 RepID=UPI0025E74CFD|nr:hypothetical protein [uncultured Microbacterium sp.]